jgi:phosphoglycerol transferase
MTGRTLFHVTLLVALAAFYSVTTYVALHPRVSEHYRDYYIRRATTDWTVARGTARLADGFDFADTVYPQEVDYLRGLSLPEPWGRRSDASMAPAVSILLREPLSGSLCLDVRFRATPLQSRAPVAIRLGDQSATVVPSDTQPRDYRLEVQLTRPAQSIDFEPSRPTPAGGWDPINRTPSRIAIGLIRLQLRPGPCPG